MKKIDGLLKRAKAFTGRWKPFQYMIQESGGEYVVSRHLWNGVPGSLCPSELERQGVKPYTEWRFNSKSDAICAVQADIDKFEREHDCKISPLLFDLCKPTEKEQKEMWRKSGGSVLEREADRAGIPLEAYIRQEFGPPKFTESFLQERLSANADIIRWRKEDGIDGETTIAVKHADRGSQITGETNK